MKVRRLLTLLVAMTITAGQLLIVTIDSAAARHKMEHGQDGA